MTEEQLNQFKKLMITKLGTSDDASAQLVSDIVDSASGGGGSSLPECTITLVNNSSDVVYFSHLSTEENGIEFTTIELAVNASETINSLYMYASNDDIWIVYDTQMNEYWWSGSDAVNCTVIGGGRAIKITDPTKDSSITMTIVDEQQ